jgi:hypothetical protein
MVGAEINGFTVCGSHLSFCALHAGAVGPGIIRHEDMSADTILATLVDYLNTKQAISDGTAHPEELAASKKRFADALNEYLDWRFEASYEKRRKHMSSQRIQAADAINSTVKGTAASIRSMSALNSAPPPPKDKNPEAVEKWYRDYKAWYENARKKGMNIS